MVSIALLVVGAGLVGADWTAAENDTALPAPATRKLLATTTTIPVPGVPPPTKIAMLAVATGSSVSVRANPGDTVITRKLSNPTIERMPLAMFVVDRSDNWLQVRMPERPNNALGWIETSEVALDAGRQPGRDQHW